MVERRHTERRQAHRRKADRRGTERRKTDRMSIASMTLALACAVVVAVFGFPALLAVNSLTQENDKRIEEVAQLAREIQVQREDNIVRGCIEDSRQNEATLEFLERLGTSERTLRQARMFFPVMTHAECEARARARTTP
jgi:hypothetical protein